MPSSSELDGSLKLLWSLAAGLPKSNAEASAVFLEEFDPGGFDSFLQLDLGIVRYPRAEATFETLNRRKRQPSAGGKFRLGPTEKASRSTELFNRLHVRFFLI